ncbi:MAG: Gfo/Idh/MocA family oxidoreductase [Anaerolineae bacterium]
MKGKTPVRIGVVGTGIGALHIAGIASMPEVTRLAAICSLDLDAARSLGERYGAGYVTDRYEELLSDPDIDVIDLCTPPREHLPMAVAAAQAGKHILVEKPLARTLDEADAIIRAAREANVKLMTSHNQRYFAHHAKAKELLDAGVIGDPFMIVATVHVHGHIQGFRRFLDPAGGGTLIDSGVHRFDLLRWLMGDVDMVFAQTGRFMQMQMEGEDCAVVTLRFSSGAIGSFSCSWSAKGPRPEESLQIFGPKGAILTEDHSRSLTLRAEDPPPGLAPVTEFRFDVDQQESIRRAIEAFARSLQDGTEVPIPGEDGRASLELALASYRAQETGQPVRLPM